jgi:hypothetical protein
MNKLYILILIVLSSLNITEIFGQGTCATAITIPTKCIGSGGTVSGAVGSGTPVSTCTDGTGQVWFSFTVPSGRTTASLTISGYNCTGGGCKGNLVIFNSCGGSQAITVCADNDLNGTWNLTGLTAGSTYYILLGSTGTLTGPITASVSFAASTTPLGQAESEAITLTNGGAPISQSMCDADGVASLSGADYCGSTYLYERWYAITLPTGCSGANINLTNVDANGGTLSVDILNRSNTGCNGTAGLYVRGGACITGASGTASTDAISFGAGGGTYLVVVNSSNPGATYSIDFDVNTPSTAEGSSCASPYLLSSNDGIGTSTTAAHSTSNECALVSLEDASSLVNTCGTDGLAGVSSTVFTGSGCTPSIENSQYFSFQVPIDGTYSVFIGNQNCSGGDGIQFFLADNLTCGSPNTATGFMGCSSTNVTSNQQITNITLTASNTYYIVTDGYAGDVCDYDILITQSATNPFFDVELIEFRATKSPKGVKLKWSTGSETENSYFAVQYSLDGRNFTEISKVYSKAPNGNSSNLLEYSLEHLINHSGTVYYRLAQFDKSGRFTYSTMRSISLQKEKDGIKISPNPVGNEFNLSIESLSDQKINILIHDITGKTIINKNISLVQGSNNINVDVNNLEKGLYIITLFDSNNNRIGFSKFSK